MTAHEICSLLFFLHLSRYLSVALAGAIPNTTNEMIVENVSSEPRGSSDCWLGRPNVVQICV